MKSAILLISLIMIQILNPLAEFKWKKRIVVVHTSGENDQYLKQVGLIRSTFEKWEDRDMLLVSLFNASGSIDDRKLKPEELQTLQSEYPSFESGFSIYLIGKDGGIKLKRSEVIDPSELYQLIDTMPMRKKEIGY